MKKVKYYEKTDSIVTMEKLFPSGYYLVELSGKSRDKIKCDNYKIALDYFRSFCKIAKNGV
jgi:hypothetical protein